MVPFLYVYDSALLIDNVESIVYVPLSEIQKSHNFVYNDMYSKYVDIKLISRVSNLTLLEFVSLQYHIIVNTGESTLVFFRMYNPTSFDVLGISMYYVFPTVYAVYLGKIQCFCFDLLQIYSGETVELPVSFYISSLVDSTFSTNKIIISYVYFVN